MVVALEEALGERPIPGQPPFKCKSVSAEHIRALIAELRGDK